MKDYYGYKSEFALFTFSVNVSVRTIHVYVSGVVDLVNTSL